MEITETIKENVNMTTTDYSVKPRQPTHRRRQFRKDL